MVRDKLAQGWGRVFYEEEHAGSSRAGQAMYVKIK